MGRRDGRIKATPWKHWSNLRTVNGVFTTNNGIIDTTKPVGT